MEKIDIWFKQFENCNKLTFTEAKKQYEETLFIGDSEERKEKLNEIVVGTMHALYEFLKNQNLKMFKASSFDLDDIISSFTEQWIISIKHGALLVAKDYSSIINTNFINTATNTVTGMHEILDEKYEFTKIEFTRYLYKYIELKNNNEEVSFNDFLIAAVGENNVKYLKKEEYSLLGQLYDYCENIYNRLSKNNNKEEIKLSQTMIDNYANLLVEMGEFDRLGETLSDNDLESDFITKITSSELNDAVASANLSDFHKDILYRYYGLLNLANQSSSTNVSDRDLMITYEISKCYQNEYRQTGNDPYNIAENNDINAIWTMIRRTLPLVCVVVRNQYNKMQLENQKLRKCC